MYKLTEEEKEELQDLYKQDSRYLARDEDGHLWAFEEYPTQNHSNKYGKYWSSERHTFSVEDSLFKCVESNCVCKIKELLFNTNKNIEKIKTLDQEEKEILVEQLKDIKNTALNLQDDLFHLRDLVKQKFVMENEDKAELYEKLHDAAFEALDIYGDIHDLISATNADFNYLKEGKAGVKRQMSHLLRQYIVLCHNGLFELADFVAKNKVTDKEELTVCVDKIAKGIWDTFCDKFANEEKEGK